MKKHGLAKLGQLIGNLSAGKFSDFQYDRRKVSNLDLSRESKWIFNNAKIVNVDKGKIYEEEAILVDGTRFGERLRKHEVEELSERPEIEYMEVKKILFTICLLMNRLNISGI